MTYMINRGVSRPIEFKGLQAQYITYLGLGSVALLIVFAVLYLLGVSPYVCVTLVLGASVAMVGYIYRLSNRYGAHGLMKRTASGSLPLAIRARDLDERLPILGVEDDCLVSRHGDLTVGYVLTLPEIFTLSNEQYEALHAAWVKAIRVLPPGTVLHKQDWFVRTGFQPKDTGEDNTFLSGASDHHFFERPYLEHDAYLFLTKRADEQRLSTSATSNLLHPRFVPAQVLDPQRVQAFLGSVEQAVQLLLETGLIQVERMKEPELLKAVGRYSFLQAGGLQKDLSFKDGLRVGNQYAQLFTLADATSLPSSCSPWRPYARYSTETSPLPVGFGSAIGQFLDCNHLYSQYIVVGDPRETIKGLERKKRRLQSLANYSRSNAIARDDVDAFLQEAAKDQRLPVKAHFNVLVWADDPGCNR